MAGILEKGINRGSKDQRFLDVARPPSRDPPPGDRLPGARFARTDLKSGRASERGRATLRKIKGDQVDKSLVSFGHMAIIITFGHNYLSGLA
eukprot:1179747-Prorocentrum_minimum.AAC.4